MERVSSLSRGRKSPRPLPWVKRFSLPAQRHSGRNQWQGSPPWECPPRTQIHPFPLPGEKIFARPARDSPSGDPFPRGPHRSSRDPEPPALLGMQEKQLRNPAGAGEVTHMWTACQVIFVVGLGSFFTSRNSPARFLASPVRPQRFPTSPGPSPPLTRTRPPPGVSRSRQPAKRPGRRERTGGARPSGPGPPGADGGSDLLST